MPVAPRPIAVLVAAVGIVATANPSSAGEADVVAAEATQSPDGSWRFDVSVRHADEGWEHYADAWEVVSLDGEVLATRTLLHPHEYEQPFTRSLSGVAIPADADAVEIRAHDSVHGYGGVTLRVTLATGVPSQ
jgi:hypothetical protein